MYVCYGVADGLFADMVASYGNDPPPVCALCVFEAHVAKGRHSLLRHAVPCFSQITNVEHQKSGEPPATPHCVHVGEQDEWAVSERGYRHDDHAKHLRRKYARIREEVWEI